MADVREIRVVPRLEGRVRVPGSKSLTLRALCVAALARGRSVVFNALVSGDSRVLARALEALGARIRVDEAAHRIEIESSGGAPRVPGASLDAADCGTCLRLLLAVAAAGEGRIELDGTERMRERPVGGLADALVRAGASLEFPGRRGYPPVIVHGRGLAGGRVSVDARASSQFVSALLLVGPLAAGGLEIRPAGAFPSRPYVGLTADVMEAFGATVEDRGSRFRVPAGAYTARSYDVEGDWSSASYFLAAAAVTRGTVLVQGIREGSRQGDRRFLDFLTALGSRFEATPRGVRLTGGDRAGDVSFDFGDCPDVVPTAAVVAAFHDGRVELTGAPHLRWKESDRIAAVCGELRRLGARASERDDGLVVEGGRPLRGADVRTFDDHRIAMSFAVAGLRVPGVRILDPACVTKSYPGFFDDLQRLGAGPGAAGSVC